MEDIVKKYLDEILVMRFDICTCDHCRQDIIAYTLSRIPPKYVTSDAGAMRTLVDQVKVEQAAEILKELVNAVKVIGEQPHHEVAGDKEIAYVMLMRQIKLDRGIDFSQYRDRVLKRRLALRMRATGAKSYAEYLQVLIHNSEEYKELFEVLTINVTSFFRDEPVWNLLKKEVFPDLIASKKKMNSERIRIWSAGCSSGEEPYSLAILLYELNEQENFKFKIEIIGTDIDDGSLKHAEEGKYDRSSLKTVNAYRLKRFFIPVEDKFLVVPQVKDLVRFKKQDLVHGPGVPAVDMVTCRNVFIYFNRSLQEHLIMKFYRSLVDDGNFIMGNTENLLGEARQLFKVVNSEYRIFQKISGKNTNI